MAQFKIPLFTCLITHAIGSFEQSAHSKSEVLALFLAMTAYAFPTELNLTDQEYIAIKNYLKSCDNDFVDFMNEKHLKDGLHQAGADYIYISEYMHTLGMTEMHHLDTVELRCIHEFLQQFNYQGLETMFTSLSTIPWNMFSEVLERLMGDFALTQFQYIPKDLYAYYQAVYCQKSPNEETALML